MLYRWCGWRRLECWCVTLVEAGFDLAYGVRSKGDAHEGSDCLGLGVWWLALSCGLGSRRGDEIEWGNRLVEIVRWV